MPDKVQKEIIWKQLLGFDSTEKKNSNSSVAQVQKFSMQQLSAKIGGFYQWGQEDVLTTYFDQYYSVIQDPRLYQNQGYKYLQNLIAGLLPVERVVTQEDVEKLKKIQKELPLKDAHIPEFYLKLLSDAEEKL